MPENYVYTDFRHDKIIFLKSFIDEYSYNTPYLQHCTDKKNSLKTFFFLRNSPVQPLLGGTSNILNEWSPVIAGKLGVVWGGVYVCVTMV